VESHIFKEVDVYTDDLEQNCGKESAHEERKQRITVKTICYHDKCNVLVTLLPLHSLKEVIY
jgi:hypothetical protein